jgi:hypothetical protein
VLQRNNAESRPLKVWGLASGGPRSQRSTVAVSKVGLPGSELQPTGGPHCLRSGRGRSGQEITDRSQVVIGAWLGLDYICPSIEALDLATAGNCSQRSTRKQVQGVAPFSCLVPCTSIMRLDPIIKAVKKAMSGTQAQVT